MNDFGVWIYSFSHSCRFLPVNVNISPARRDQINTWSRRWHRFHTWISDVTSCFSYVSGKSIFHKGEHIWFWCRNDIIIVQGCLWTCWYQFYRTGETCESHERYQWLTLKKALLFLRGGNDCSIPESESNTYNSSFGRNRQQQGQNYSAEGSGPLLKTIPRYLELITLDRRSQSRQNKSPKSLFIWMESGVRGSQNQD